MSLLNQIIGKVCCGADADAVKVAGKETRILAMETSDLCNKTKGNTSHLITFGNDVKSTFKGFKDGFDQTDINSIKELLGGGQRIKDTIQIASDMDDLALGCFSKAVDMIKSMERGIDGLPKPVKEELDDELNQNEKDRNIQDSDGIVPNVDDDIRALEECTASIENMNILTAKKSGEEAFDSIISKTEVCSTMFEKIKEFSAKIISITDAFLVDGGFCVKLTAIVSKVKDMIKAIRISKLIKAFADSVHKLIKAIIRLMEVILIKFKNIPGADKIEHGINKIADKIEDKIGVEGVGSLISNLLK